MIRCKCEWLQKTQDACALKQDGGAGCGGALLGLLIVGIVLFNVAGLAGAGGAGLSQSTAGAGGASGSALEGAAEAAAADSSGDQQSNSADLASLQAGTSAVAGNKPEGLISIILVGDVNFADGWGADYADSQNHQVAAAIDAGLLQELQSADIFYANHEFTMSDRGEPLGKYYTFRASPNKADYWRQLGVDVVGLANNHAYDYGEQAFLDTLDTLEATGIKHTGAGRNLAKAMAPAVFTINGYIIAFVAADRSQKGDEQRAAAAGETNPGVLFCFDDQLFITAVANAAANADFVIAIPHWGAEGSTYLEDVQLELGQKLIDAGASAVIGAHPHILQGLDFYQGKLIAYSLGNFWFNWETGLTVAMKIEIVNGQPSYQVIPALQSERQLLVTDAVTIETLDTLRSLSPTLEISNEGKITPRL